MCSALWSHDEKLPNMEEFSNINFSLSDIYTILKCTHLLTFG